METVSLFLKMIQHLLLEYNVYNYGNNLTKYNFITCYISSYIKDRKLRIISKRLSESKDLNKLRSF